MDFQSPVFNGDLPSNWRSVALEDLCIPQGMVRGPFGGALKKDMFVSDGYKVYEQRNAIYRSASIGNYFIDKGKFRDLERFSISPGDFIVSCSGTIGRIYRIPVSAPQGVINQALLKLTVDERVVDPTYFFYYFDWEEFQEQIIENTHGGAMQNLVGMSVFRKIDIPLPPLPEQRAIAAALSDIDALIASLDALIAKKRDIKQATMQQLLTGRTRLPGFRGEWEERRIGDFAPLQRGFDLPNSQLQQGPFPVVYSNGIMNHHAKYQVRGPGVVTGRSGTIGKVQFVADDFWPHNTALWVTSFKANDPKFVFFLFSALHLERFGSGSGVPTLNRNDVHAFRVRIPLSALEQTAIAEVLSDMDAEITALEARRDKTRAIKQGMMQELLTGRTRLPIAETAS